MGLSQYGSANIIMLCVIVSTIFFGIFFSNSLKKNKTKKNDSFNFGDIYPNKDSFKRTNEYVKKLKTSILNFADIHPDNNSDSEVKNRANPMRIRKLGGGKKISNAISIGSGFYLLFVLLLIGYIVSYFK